MLLCTHYSFSLKLGYEKLDNSVVRMMSSSESLRDLLS